MGRWMDEKRRIFERDLFRDFCEVSDLLSEQFARFAQTGVLSYTAMQNIIGDFTNKELIWRLKDTAHLILHDSDEKSAAALLDWTLGYIFHEALKLKEDAHLAQSYVRRLSRFADREMPAPVRKCADSMDVFKAQPSQSMAREVERLTALMGNARRLFCLYFEGMASHRPLARFIYDRNALVRRVFHDDYYILIKEIYGSSPERMYLEAARSLLESARFDEAGAAIEAALENCPACNEAIELKKELQNAAGKIA